MLGTASISLVLDVLEPERSALVELLDGLGSEDWARPTECPAYSVKGVATHLLGDRLSLLSRQRDQAIDGQRCWRPIFPGPKRYLRRLRVSERAPYSDRLDSERSPDG
jgi:hypothetical protein